MRGTPVAAAKAGFAAGATATASRRRGLRWQHLLAVALLGVLALALLAHSLSRYRTVDATWRAEGAHVVELASSPVPALATLAGVHLERIGTADGSSVEATDGVLHRTPRWSVDDVERVRQTDTQRRLAAMLQSESITLHFAGAEPVELRPSPRGYLGLGPFFWLLCATALALWLVTAIVMLAYPQWRNMPFAVIGLCQAGNLLAIGIETMPGLGLPPPYVAYGLALRLAFDLGSAAALVQLATLQPLRLPARRRIAAAAWAVCLVVWGLAVQQRLPSVWWSAQAAMVGCGASTVALLSWSYRLEPNPFALLMRRLAGAATATLLLLSAAVALAHWHPGIGPQDAAFSSVVWYLFLSVLVLLLPVFLRVRQLMRELAMLAATCTIATSLNLLLIATFSIGAAASLSVSIFVALAIYAAARQWLMQPLSGQSVPSADRMFERLHRVLREVEAQPRHSAQLLTRLLQDLFEPLEVGTLDRASSRSRVLGDGSALLVPLPSIDANQPTATDGSIVLRFAAHGKRMFSRDDARLSDRLVEQLRRAVAYDHAVERGRSEERARIAQDLHDDIGARLLTLMYKAQSPEMEDYIRHTLKDLKTLTRGLASSELRLSHAAAEWKTDIAQRLNAAQIELVWSFGFDRDVVLGVVQWSALTRVLRELVSNVIQHSCATHLEVSATLQAGRLRLSLSDDGIGRNPQAWSHGLGLGGVRKRVKLLGGDVQWRENGRVGIVCTVVVPDIGPHE